MTKEVFINELEQAYKLAGPLERAKAFKQGRALGLSNPQLGKIVGRSATHVRELVSLLRLTQQQQAAIAAGAPYRPYLDAIRQGARDKKKRDEDLQQIKAQRAIKRGVTVLRGWLQSFNLAEAYAEQALEEVRREIMMAELGGQLKPSETVWQGKPEEVFASNVPAGWEKMESIDLLNAVVRCVARSVVMLMPNSDVRLKVIGTALSNPHQLTTAL